MHILEESRALVCELEFLPFVLQVPGRMRVKSLSANKIFSPRLRWKSKLVLIKYVIGIKSSCG
jgi:hypothetical protein